MAFPILSEYKNASHYAKLAILGWLFFAFTVLEIEEGDRPVVNRTPIMMKHISQLECTKEVVGAIEKHWKILS